MPPGKYLYIFVAKNSFTIFNLLLLQPMLLIKSFHAKALIIILKKLKRIPANSHNISLAAISWLDKDSKFLYIELPRNPKQINVTKSLILILDNMPKSRLYL
jgi:hypothetical protein